MFKLLLMTLLKELANLETKMEIFETTHATTKQNMDHLSSRREDTAAKVAQVHMLKEGCVRHKKLWMSFGGILNGFN